MAVRPLDPFCPRGWRLGFPCGGGAFVVAFPRFWDGAFGMEEGTEISSNFSPGDWIDRRFVVVRSLESHRQRGESYLAQDGEKEVVLRFFQAIPGDQTHLRFKDFVDHWHPIDDSSIVPFDKGGEWRGSPYLVRRWVEGVSLSQVLAERARRGSAFTPEEVSVWITGLLEGMKKIHSRGCFGNLKPSNIFLDRESKVVLTDFSLHSLVPHPEFIGSYLMKEGYYYFAPEWIAEERISKVSDIYSIGVVLQAMLTLDFSRGSGVADRIQGSPWETILIRCLDQDPDGRFRSIEELEMALHSVLERRPLPGESVPSPTPLLSEASARSVEGEGSSEPSSPPVQKSGDRHGGLWFGVLVAAVTGMILGFRYLSHYRAEDRMTASPSDLKIEVLNDMPFDPSNFSAGEEATPGEGVEQAIGLQEEPSPVKTPPESIWVPACPREMRLIETGENPICIDKRPYPNIAGTPPLAPTDFTEAVERCLGIHKRLCTAEEWEVACRGWDILRPGGYPEWVVDPFGEAQLERGEGDPCDANGEGGDRSKTTFRCCSSPFMKSVPQSSHAS